MRFLSAILLLILLAACAPALPTSTPTLIPSATEIPPTLTPQPSSTATTTRTATITHTPTVSATPTVTPTATISLTPTFDFPKVQVNVAAANCRYGPNQAYLHAADLYQGDRGEVRGRWYLNGWLHVRFDKLSYHCWVAPGAVDVTGSLDRVIVLNQIDLTRIGTNQYGSPQGLTASRQGDAVTISWNQMVMTEDKDRGYFLDMFVCQNGGYLWWPVSFANQSTTSYTVTDEAGCSQPSRGVIYTVEKHGYSQPEAIPWP